LSHWEAVLQEDSRLHIKVCPKLTVDHIKPLGFQTMNVQMAYQVSELHCKENGLKVLKKVVLKTSSPQRY